MSVELRVSPSQIEDILRQVRGVDVEHHWQGQAYALEVSKIGEWVQRLWSTIEEAIGDVSRQGKERIDVWMTRIGRDIKTVRDQLGDKSKAVFSAIEEKLAAFYQKMWEIMLKLLPTTVTVSGGKVGLSEIGLQYQVTVGAGVEGGLQSALKLSAGGTLSVSTKYTLPTGG